MSIIKTIDYVALISSYCSLVYFSYQVVYSHGNINDCSDYERVGKESMKDGHIVDCNED